MPLTHDQGPRCDSCRRIDIKKTLLREPSTLSGSDSIIEIPLFSRKGTDSGAPSLDCAFCRFVAGSKARRAYKLAPRNFLEIYRGFRQPAYKKQPNKYLGYGSTCLEVGDNLFFVPDTKSGLLAPRRVSNTFDPEFAISWLSKCKSFHPPTCVPTSIGFPERVIDCLTRTVTPGHPGIQYIALSYVWGLKTNALKQEYMLSTTRDPSRRLPDELPQTIEDAIKVTSMIGYRYIWIDMYCIDQTDIGDKQRQVAHMDVVYAGADATIIVAAGDDCYSGIPGIGNTPRKAQQSVNVDGVDLYAFGNSVGKELRESKWWTRAWTFQEGLLSHRRLVFTESQAFFECNTMTSAEAIGGLELVRTRSEMRLYKEIFDNGIFKCLLTNEERFQGFFDGSKDEVIYSPPDADSTIHLFKTLVRIYTAKHLSFDSDTLNAFNAIAMSFSRSRRYPKVTYPSVQRTVLNLGGVPFTSNKDSLQVSLTNGLLWSHGYGTQVRRRRCFPSWTWAEYESVVDWEVLVEIPHWRIVRVGAGCDTSYDISELGEPYWRGDTIRAQEINIRARVIRPEMWQTLQYNGGKWTGPPDSAWGKCIFASPILHGFAKASSKLLPNLMSGRWAALCAGSSRRSGTLALYLIETSADGDSMRVDLAEMRYGWTSSHSEEAEREDAELRSFLEQGTVERLVKLV
ncbi:HET-domain-containing protein [Nemania serpens]|nr:HET-domain-containing protein [Nemania serpens]